MIPFPPTEKSTVLATTRALTPEPATLRREHLELLLDVGLCLQRYGMYPGGHPSLDAAVTRLAVRLGEVLRERESLSIGVARRQLIVDQAATDPSHPVLRSIADRLYRHRLGAVAFRRGVTVEELAGALGAVSSDPERSGEPLGSASAERLAAWPSIRFYRVTYEQLQLAASEEAERDGDGSGAGAADELWRGLAQAALQRDGDGAAADVGGAEVAGAISAAGDASYDRMIVEYMVQLAGGLRRDGAGASEVRLRLSDLIRSLEPAALQRLLEMGGDAEARRRLLLDATDTLRPDAVLEVVQAAARAEGQDISTSMLRMLRKLSVHADADAAVPGDRADAELREQVRRLIDGWTLDDPNPDAYTHALEGMARGAAGPADDFAMYDAEPLRIVQMGIEVEASGLTFWRAVDALLADARLAELLDVMDAVDSGNDTVALLWRRLESADHIRHLLTTDPVDFASLDRIFARLPAATIISLLLDRLSESTSRATRMGVFRRLSARGYAAVPMVAERLADGRWFVLRNMLALLNEIGAWPHGFSAQPYARHGQPMVRREALLLGTRIAAEREQSISLALTDRDERVVRIGINASLEGGLPPRLVGTVLQRLDDDEISGELRASLIRLLARHVSAPVVERLVRFVLYETRLLGRAKLAPRTTEMLAALTILAAARTNDPRARTALELARASADADIRAAAGAP